MAHSSTPGTPKIETTMGTMTAVPSPGGNEQYSPAAETATQVHGMFPEGGNQMVDPKSTPSTKMDWPDHGGNQKIMPK